MQKHYNELRITQQLFSDFALHNLMQMNKQNSKNGNAVLSKFSKHKRNTWYYSLSAAKAEIYYIGATKRLDADIKKQISII